ncbi:MAG: hypothetical protein H6732_02850 [Alphaproteobacteria bacterium]|nr:hypothetical protein [Alphaproteobacteria bacterium]
MRAASVAIGAGLGAALGALAGWVEAFTLVGGMATPHPSTFAWAAVVDALAGALAGALVGVVIPLRARVAGLAGAVVAAVALVLAHLVAPVPVRVPAPLGAAPPAEVPSVLLVLVDELPARRWGTDTPQLEALAAGAARLHTVVAPSPSVQAARSLLLWGRNAPGRDDRGPATARALAWLGHDTAAVLRGDDRRSADDARGFAHLVTLEPEAGLGLPRGADRLLLARGLAALRAAPAPAGADAAVDATRALLAARDSSRPFALVVELDDPAGLAAVDAAVGALVAAAEQAAGARPLVVAVGGLTGDPDAAVPVSLDRLATPWLVRGPGVVDVDVAVPVPLLGVPGLVVAATAGRPVDLFDGPTLDARRLKALAVRHDRDPIVANDLAPCRRRPPPEPDLAVVIHHVTPEATWQGYRLEGWAAWGAGGAPTLVDELVDPAGHRDLVSAGADTCGRSAGDRAAALLALHAAAMDASAAGAGRELPAHGAFLDEDLYPDPLATP